MARWNLLFLGRQALKMAGAPYLYQENDAYQHGYFVWSNNVVSAKERIGGWQNEDRGEELS